MRLCRVAACVFAFVASSVCVRTLRRLAAVRHVAPQFLSAGIYSAVGRKSCTDLSLCACLYIYTYIRRLACDACGVHTSSLVYIYTYVYATMRIYIQISTCVYVYLRKNQACGRETR